jgi:hypothetical protein
MLTSESREQRVNGSRAPFDVLRQREKIHFHDIIPDDESWIFIDAAPSSIWLSLDERLPTCPRPTISADKCMLAVFWGIKRIVQVIWLPKNPRISAASFLDEVLTPLSQKLQEHASGGCKSWTSMHMDNAKIHTTTAVSTIMPDLRLKRTLEPFAAQICVYQTSSFLIG